MVSGRRAGHPKQDTRSPAQRAVEEAEACQQRGERRKHQEAATSFQQAVVYFRQALTLGLTPAEAEEARFGLAECLQLCAEATFAAAAHLPDAQLTAAVEQHAGGEACALYRQAAAAYEQVTAAGQPQRADAAVNCGNTLAAHAELLLALQEAAAAAGGGAGALAAAGGPPGGAVQGEAAALLDRAVVVYRRALELEDDALTWSNLGDALVQHGDALHGAGDRPGGDAAFQAALQAYHRACALCDSTSGDDLPGLLCNWAAGELALAQWLQVPAERHIVLEGAAARLRQAIDFDRGDPEPATVLGDVFSARAELAASPADADAAAFSQQQGTGPAEGPADAAGWWARAIEEGYDCALAMNRSHTPALVSKAEALHSWSRLHATAGDWPSAAQGLDRCCVTYEEALRNPPAVGGFGDRCAARFNLACAAAASAGCWERCISGGGASALEVTAAITAAALREAQARSLLTQLVACGGANVAEMAVDEDLQALRGRPWFDQMVALIS